MLGRKANLGLTLAFTVLVAASFYYLNKPASIADISEEHRHYTGELLQAWEKGDVIVLLRHLERCDKYDVPCLTAKKGITTRAKPVGVELRDDFFQLGLEKTVVYNSPELRTAETEAIVFNDVGQDRDWLINCHDDFLGDILQNKQERHNLVLVTHSRCIKRFQEQLDYEEESPMYGSAIFVLPAGPTKKSVKVLGFLDAEDWLSTLGF
jgi:phosphohistidine phosphatase SixA